MLKVEGLTKHYGALTAVSDVCFEVQTGEVLGFLGPNGAGKTTTMRMIAGFVPPSAGRAIVCGYPVDSEPVEAKRKLGYLPEGAPAYGEMTPADFLAFIAAARGMDAAARARRMGAVVERLQLGSVLHRPIETLSKGFRRRVGLAQAILHDPPVLILDEPTDGLDPNQKHEVRQLIAEMAPEKIIVISTHILEEVDAVCTRAIIIAGGRLLADETPAGLIARSRYHNAVTLTLAPGTAAEPVAAALGAVPGVASVEHAPGSLTMTAFPAAGDAILTRIADLAAAQEWPLDRLALESGRLDEVFRSITRQEAA
ncbi:MAG: ABC transporter ATP-binding protein [Chromatiales bacterium]|nr:ABC transporter ATP-binding protein [Chromatiales bacterium]